MADNRYTGDPSDHPNTPRRLGVPMNIPTQLGSPERPGDPSATRITPDRGSLGEERVRHLEFVQAVVARQASNSFYIKGWTLTVAAAFFAIQSDHLSWPMGLVAFLPLIAFWALDAYYLRSERLFRHLYEDVRKVDGGSNPSR